MLIYICYRRADSRAISGRICAHLASMYGPAHVYMDAPESAVPSPQQESALSSSTLVLALIGPQWSAPSPEGTPDTTYQELALLCQRGVPIIPVLVDGATLPAPSLLPPAIAGLAQRDAVLLSSGRDFPYGLHQLLEAIDSLTGSHVAEQQPHSVRSRPGASSYAPHTVDDEDEEDAKQSKRTLWMGATFGALGVIAAVALAVTHTDVPPSRSESPQLVERPRIAAASGPGVSATGCSSPWASRCAGNACSGLIGDTEQLELHLSGIYLSEGADPCAERTVRDLWLCQGQSCLSQREACTHSQKESRSYTTASLNVLAAQLERGLELSVREGGSSGTVLATLKPTYGDPLLKQPFLCWGGTWGRQALGAAAGPVVKVTYYLEPR